MRDSAFPKQQRIADKVFNTIRKPGADGVTCFGRYTEECDDEQWADHWIISDCVFDFRNIPTKDQDEVLSSVAGPEVWMERCLILGGIKALLCGNGDHKTTDHNHTVWNLRDCVIVDSGRRCPEAQDGAEVYMDRCWVHNWGQTFDVRAFGGWAHSGGMIHAKDCIFTQKGGLFSLGLGRTLSDMSKHAWQEVLDTKNPLRLFWPMSWLPGVARGLTAIDGGYVKGISCYKNKKWIRLENTTLTDIHGAKEIIKQIEAGFIDTTPYLGQTISNYFLSEVC